MAKKKYAQKTKTTVKNTAKNNSSSKTTNSNKAITTTEKKASKKKYQHKDVDYSSKPAKINQLTEKELEVINPIEIEGFVANDQHKTNSHSKDIYTQEKEALAKKEVTDVPHYESILIDEERPVQAKENLSNLAPSNEFKMTEQNTTITTQTPEKQDWNRIFTVLEQDLNANKQRMFLHGIYVNVNTSFQRVSNIDYKLTGFNEDGITPFIYNLPLDNQKEGDDLWNELVAMEKSRTTTDKTEPTVNNLSESITDDTKEEAPVKNRRGRPKKGSDGSKTPDGVTEGKETGKIAQPKEPENDPTITEIDVDAVVANPLGGGYININQPSNQANLAPSTQTPEAMNIRQLNDMEVYCRTIHDAIMGNFRVRVQGGQISSGEVQSILNNSLKEYTYELKNDNGAFFIVASRGGHTMRIPREEGTFLPVV